MSDTPDLQFPEELTPLQLSARKAVRALPRVEADAAFRKRLREQFVSGRFDIDVRGSGEATATFAAASQTTRAETRAGRAVRRAGLRPRRRFWVAAAAVAAVAAFGLLQLNAGPAYELSVLAGAPAMLRVDDQPLSLSSPARVEAALRPGARVQVPEGARLRLVSTGVLALEITGGSELTLPGVPGRWWGRSQSAHLHRGRLRLTTGPGFEGARLRVVTPEADVRVTGTTLTVICNPGGTSVSVLEGEVHVENRASGHRDTVAGGEACTVTTAGETEMGDIAASEHEQLRRLREETAASLWNPGEV